jgi:hypothetical protein
MRQKNQPESYVFQAFNYPPLQKQRNMGNVFPKRRISLHDGNDGAGR